MQRLKEMIEALASIPENAWGFGILLLAALMALEAASNTNTNLWGFVSGLSMTGAAVMHARKE